MAYGTEAMIPVKVRVPLFRYENFDEETNTSLLAAERDTIKEWMEVARVRMEAQKQRMARYYDSRVKERKFKVGDTVLRQVFQNTKEPGAGAPGYSWDGPYRSPRFYDRGHTDSRTLLASQSNILGIRSISKSITSRLPSLVIYSPSCIVALVIQ